MVLCITWILWHLCLHFLMCRGCWLYRRVVSSCSSVLLSRYCWESRCRGRLMYRRVVSSCSSGLLSRYCWESRCRGCWLYRWWVCVEMLEHQNYNCGHCYNYCFYFFCFQNQIHTFSKKENFLQLQSQFSDYHFIYTDGSKEDNKVGCGTYTKDACTTLRLPDGS